jgi:adenosylcobinamide kinase / adenosylcobinamide-phosphate guanylyltransferase
VLGKLILVGGGVRSGKSGFAVERALRAGSSRAFVATATAFDEEMKERIARHQEDRRALFTTIEAPTDLRAAAASMPRYDVVLLDCLTLYVSNLLLVVPDVDALTMVAIHQLELACLHDVQTGIDALRSRAETVIVVTNEVGQGIVPVSRLGRLFRDIAGRINQSVAQSASEVWFCAFGLPLRLKPSLCEQNPLDSVGDP